MKYFLMGFLITWSNAAIASEPVFAPLKKGERAPFDGRLFNDAAVSKLIIENRLKAEQCNIEIEFHKSRAIAKENYKYALLEAKSQAADERLNDLISIKQDEIDRISKQLKPNRNSWWLAGGFVTGVLTSIGIMHAVK
tara:strand:+ start:238 stop:651 length:414 start_codon:yes stop_codon:yes gene_type:complete